MNTTMASSSRISRLRRLFLSAQFGKFIVSGGVAALCNWLTGEVVRAFLDGHFWYTASVIAGFAVGTLVSFGLNKYYTFRAHDEPTHRQLAKYLATAVVGTLLAAGLAWAYVFVLRRFTPGIASERWIESGGHALAIGTTTFFNFLAIKYFALRARSTRSATRTEQSEPEQQAIVGRKSRA